VNITLSYSAVAWLVVVVLIAGIISGGWAQYQEMRPRTFGEQARAPRNASFEAGRESALETLADTDENAAIVEWIGSGKMLVLYDCPNYRDTAPTSFSVNDADIARANLHVCEKTPWAAYRVARDVRGTALAICDQLDALKARQISEGK